MTNYQAPLVKCDKSCGARVAYTDPPRTHTQPPSITLYEDDILDIARIVYYFSYLLPPALGEAYKVLKERNDGHASVVRDCIAEPRVSLHHLERLLIDHGFDITSLK